MKLRMFATALSVAMIASVAFGCPAHKKKAAEKAAADAKVVALETPSAETVTATADGRSETASPCLQSAKLTADKVSAKSPCSKGCSKKAATVSAKSPCGKDCDKPCCKKGAATVSAKSPCSKGCGKKAATVSAKSPCGKDCDKPCCKKGAATVSAKSPCSKAPCSKSAALTASDKAPCGGCPIAAKAKAILTSMPALKYRVGDETTGCSKSAAAMAKKAGKKMQFVVGDDVLDNEGEAMVKLTAMLEKEAASMQVVRYVAGGKCGGCPVTAKTVAAKSGSKVTYRVGGVDFATKADAQKVVKLVADAVAEVKMSYKVDGKTFGCDKAAGAKCKKTGAKMTYVIGDQETCCKIDAALKMAETKVRKIVETAAAASFSL